MNGTLWRTGFGRALCGDLMNLTKTSSCTTCTTLSRDRDSVLPAFSPRNGLSLEKRQFCQFTASVVQQNLSLTKYSLVPQIDSHSSVLTSCRDYRAVRQMISAAPVRWRSRQTFGRGRPVASDEESDDEEEEEEEDDDDDEPVDISLAKNETSIGGESKTVTKQFNLPRADYIVMHALNLDKEGFAELFYEGRITLNALLLKKKATRLSRGDKIDVVDQEDEAQRVKVVKRLIIMEVKRLSANKFKVEMELWKPGIRIKGDA